MKIGSLPDWQVERVEELRDKLVSLVNEEAERFREEMEGKATNGAAAMAAWVSIAQNATGATYLDVVARNLVVVPDVEGKVMLGSAAVQFIASAVKDLMEKNIK